MEHNLKEYNRQVIEEFREKRGKGQIEDRPRLLLTTIGARSGQPRTTPMMYIRDGDLLLVVASNAGAQRHPDWYRNLVAHPQVTVEVRAEIYDAIARVIEGAERQQVWARIVGQYPFFADHQAQITRQIPVIALERRDL